MEADALVIAVLGGGPAGMSAALWLKRMGYRPVVVEAEARLGGLQRVSNYPNEFLLGFPGLSANAIAERFSQHLAAEGIEVISRRVEQLTAGVDQLVVQTSQGVLRVAGAVACFGTRWRTLDVPGARIAVEARRLRYLGVGSGVPDAQGQRVVVVGGGDNALAAAAEVSRYAKHVTLLSRGPLRAKRLLRQLAAQCPNVEVREGWSVLAVDGDRLQVSHHGRTGELEYDLGFVTIGFVPNSEQLAAWFPQLLRDSAGYLLVDADCRTSVPRLWAAGDLCNPIHPCVATAVAMGTMAARNIELTFRDRPQNLSWSLRPASAPG